MIQARCEALFSVKSALTAPELEPYMQALYGTGAGAVAKTLQDLLLLHGGCKKASDGESYVLK